MSRSTEKLIQARMEKKATLENVNEVTKIPINDLKAIENEAFDQLPKRLALSYIHTYCEVLGVDPQPIIEACQKKLNLSSEEQQLPEQKETSEKSKQRKIHWKNFKWKKWQIWTGIGVLSVVILSTFLWLGFGLFAGGDKEAASTEEQNKVAVQESDGSDGDVDSLQDFSSEKRAQIQLIEPMEANNRGDRYEVSNVSNLEMVVFAEETVSVAVRTESSDAEPQTETFKEGQEKIFTDAQFISIKITDPTKISLSVNGVTIDTSEQKNENTYEFELIDDGSVKSGEEED